MPIATLPEVLQALLKRYPLPLRPPGHQAGGPDLFDVLEKTAAELRADGVLVSYDEFRRELAAFEDPA